MLPIRGHAGEKRIHDKIDNFQIGKAIKVHDGERFAIFSAGAIFDEVQEAYTHLKEDGYNPIVYTFPTIKPIDREVIEKCAVECDFIVTCEEHNIVGGFGSAVSEVMAEMKDRKARLVRVGLNDEYAIRVGNQKYLRSQYGIDARSIVEIILTSLDEDR